MPLYHGSRFLQTEELKPAFRYTHELVRWDQFEDNSWLYATTNKDEAIRQGFYSLMSSLLDIHRTQGAAGRIIFELYEPQSDAADATLKKIHDLGAATWLKQQTVYLYKTPLTSDWIKNNNPANGLDTEYKTQHTIPVLTHPESINMGQWLEQRGYVIELTRHGKRPYFMHW